MSDDRIGSILDRLTKIETNNADYRKRKAWQKIVTIFKGLNTKPTLPAKIKQILKNKKNAVLAGVIVVLCIGWWYVMLQRKKNMKALPALVFIGKQKCMYWNGNEYQPVSCDKKVKDTLVIALDTMRLAHLKKITKPDTITEASVGKLWYFIRNKNAEFYTCGGLHPIYTDMRLRPLTDYILNKYVTHKYP